MEERHYRTYSAAALLFLYALVCALPALFFASCSNEPIFATIENEVPLRDPSLEGTVTSVVMFNNYLYACNGTIKRKPGTAAAGTWYRVSLPGGAYRCAQLVAVNGTLYGLFQDREWEYHSLQKTTDGQSWTQVTLPDGLQEVHSIWQSANGIYTVTLLGDGGETHAADSSAIYELGSGDSPTPITFAEETNKTPVALCDKYIVTRSNESGNVYEVSGGTATLIGSAYMPMGATVHKFNGTAHLYIVGADRIFHYNDTTLQQSYGIGSYYDGLGTPAVFAPANGTPLLLIPVEEGYREARLNATTGDIMGSPNWPGEDSNSTVSPSRRSQYESSIDDYGITAMFAVTDSAYLPAGDRYAIYANIRHYKYDGLWSYYSDTEREWNRE